MKILLLYFIRCLRLSAISARQLSLIFKRNRNEDTYVFHHLPRCGGTSLRRSLVESKTVYNDYRLGWSNLYPFKYPLMKLGINDCLSGHFESMGYHLFERYPEIYTNRRFKVFTFIRDPFDLSISNYYYRRKKSQKVAKNIRVHLSETNNFLAEVLNVNDQNYRQVLDRYDFIGIFEEYEESLVRLSDLIKAEGLNERKINDAKTNDMLKSITTKDVTNFRQKNKLDYNIYDYCRDRFSSM